MAPPPNLSTQTHRKCMSPHPPRSRANRDCCNSSAAVPAPRRGRAAGAAAAAAVTVTAAPSIRPAPARPPVTSVRSQIPLGNIASRVARARAGRRRHDAGKSGSVCVWICDTGRWAADRAQKRCLGSSLHFAYVRSFLPRRRRIFQWAPPAGCCRGAGDGGGGVGDKPPHLK